MKSTFFTKLFSKKEFFIFLCALLTFSLGATAQKIVTGTIKDETGNALPGVSVFVKNDANTGTTTNASGNFILSLPSGRSTLTISSVGFRSQDITAGNGEVNIILAADKLNLSEILVTGYTSQQKKDITGSVAVVDMKSINSIPAGSAMQALQGQASGVNVISSGVPGAPSMILIRGVTTFGNNQPLVLVDGVQSDLNNLSTDDIESIQVLKDAGAASIYGVRGANGVIVVTTKKGRSGAPTVSYHGYLGRQVPESGNALNLLKSQDFARLYKIAFPNTVLFANGIPDYIYGGAGGKGVPIRPSCWRGCRTSSTRSGAPGMPASSSSTPRRSTSPTTPIWSPPRHRRRCSWRGAALPAAGRWRRRGRGWRQVRSTSSGRCSMWRDFEPAVASGGYAGAIEFDFPVEPQKPWPHLWKDIVGHVEVAADHDAKGDLLERFATGRGVRTLGFVNAHALNSCVADPAFAADLLSLDVLVRDGIGMRALYGLTGRIGGLNLNGTDLLPELLERFRGRRIALFGTRLPLVEHVARQLRASLGAEVITADGFQPDGTYLELCARHRPDLVVLGMGMPKQERVARLMKQGLQQDAAIVCGGAIIDFLSGHVVRAPLWMRRSGLEWAHRLSIEPKRLFGRYVVGNPLFMLRSLVLALRPASAAKPARRPRDEPRPLTDSRPRPRLVVEDDEIAPRLLPPRPVLTAVPAAPAAATFAANRPVVAQGDLYGRRADLDRLIAAVLEQNNNALIYAPRGYGKTSLVRVFGDVADARGHVVIYASCAKTAEFGTLMQSYLDEVPGMAPSSAASLTIGNVAARLAAVRGQSLVFILDEFDRIEREDTRSDLVDLIKDVSDLGAPVRFLLVGVATDAEQVLGFHPSVHRCITCLPVARLDDAAISELLRRKAAVDGLKLDAVAPDIVAVSAGSAYHAQLIGQKLVRTARASGNAAVSAADLAGVLVEVLDDAARIDPSVATLRSAFGDRRQAAHLVIFATMAIADPDDLLRFAASDAFAEPAITECRRLVAAGIMAPAPLPAGAVASFRFANAFVPQLIRMMQYVVEQRLRDADVLGRA